MAEKPTACSFCGKKAGEVAQLFANEDATAAICSECVAMFAQNLSDGVE